MPTSALSFYKTAVKGVKTSAVLEKYAAVDDTVLDLKSTHDGHLFRLLKEAGREQVLTGLRYGAGAAIPATLAGGLLIHQAGNEARETTEDLRNKALQTALGVGTIGAGLYGLHKATTPAHTNMSHAGHKEAAALDTPDETLSKLATVGYLDTILEAEETSTRDADIRGKLAQCRALNAEHGVQLLRDLLP